MHPLSVHAHFCSLISCPFASLAPMCPAAEAGTFGQLSFWPFSLCVLSKLILLLRQSSLSNVLWQVCLRRNCGGIAFAICDGVCVRGGPKTPPKSWKGEGGSRAAGGNNGAYLRQIFRQFLDSVEMKCWLLITDTIGENGVTRCYCSELIREGRLPFRIAPGGFLHKHAGKGQLCTCIVFVWIPPLPLP